MLRDDAIRQGKMKPTKEDIDRMKLPKKKVAEIKERNYDHKKNINRGNK